MAYQTRTELGNIRQYETFRQAVDAYRQDKTITKISFEGNRWIAITKQYEFSPSVHATLQNLSQIFALEENILRIFWVRWDSMPDDVIVDQLFQERRDGKISKEQFREMWKLSCIKEVLTEESFLNRFGYY